MLDNMTTGEKVIAGATALGIAALVFHKPTRNAVGLSDGKRSVSENVIKRKALKELLAKNDLKTISEAKKIINKNPSKDIEVKGKNGSVRLFYVANKNFENSWENHKKDARGYYLVINNVGEGIFTKYIKL